MYLNKNWEGKKSESKMSEVSEETKNIYRDSQLEKKN